MNSPFHVDPAAIMSPVTYILLDSFQALHRECRAIIRVPHTNFGVIAHYFEWYWHSSK